MGSPLSQNATVVFDSGSNWLTIMAAGKFKAYSPGLSDTQKSIRVLSEPQTYGSATLSGYIYSDTVCLSYINLKNKKPSPFGDDYDKCVKDF